MRKHHSPAARRSAACSGPGPTLREPSRRRSCPDTTPTGTGSTPARRCAPRQARACAKRPTPTTCNSRPRAGPVGRPVRSRAVLVAGHRLVDLGPEPRLRLAGLGSAGAVSARGLEPRRDRRGAEQLGEPGTRSSSWRKPNANRAADRRATARSGSRARQGRRSEAAPPRAHRAPPPTPTRAPAAAHSYGTGKSRLRERVHQRQDHDVGSDEREPGADDPLGGHQDEVEGDVGGHRRDRRREAELGSPGTPEDHHHCQVEGVEGDARSPAGRSPCRTGRSRARRGAARSSARRATGPRRRTRAARRTR